MSDIAFPTVVPVTTERPLIRYLLIAVALAFVALFLFAPLIAVFAEALKQGWMASIDALGLPDAQAAIRMTLTIAAIAVPLNAVFGIAAAWAITKFDFSGQGIPDHPDRPAILGLAGRRGADAGAPVRREFHARGMAHRQ